MRLYKISFYRKDLLRGMSIILRAGPGMFGARDTIFYVSEGCLMALDEHNTTVSVYTAVNLGTV